MLQSLINSEPQVVSDPQPQLLSGIAAQIDSVLEQHQQNLYNDIAGALGNSGPYAAQLVSAGQLLTGEKLLWQAYANFGLPSSLQTDPVLLSLLYGDQSIVDASAVQSDFSGFGSTPIINDTDNKITDEIVAMDTRKDALSAAITADLNQIQQNQTPESPDDFDTTMEDLQAFVTLKNAEALWPCNYQLSPTTASFSPGSGTATITVQEPDDCSWKASTGAGWLSMTAGDSGTGNGSVKFSLAVNAGTSPREGVIIIGDQLFRVMQAGSSSGGGGGGGVGGGGGGGGGGAGGGVVEAGVAPVARSQAYSQST